IYGRENDDQDKGWLTQEVTFKLIRDWLIPHIEEFTLGSDQIGRCLVDHIEAGTEGTILRKRTLKFKSSFRSSVLLWLCSHVVNTPLYSVRDRFLPLLTPIAKVGQISTATLLAPLLKATFAQGSNTIQERCEKEHIDTSQYVDHVMEIAKPNDRETVKLLEDYMVNPTATIHGLLYLAIFRRLRTLWPQLPAQHQVSLAGAMLDLALLDPDSRDTKFQQQEAADTLRDAKLSCETLKMLLQDRPSLVKTASERSSKRRRTTTTIHAKGDEIRRTSIILEAIESSVSKDHLPLLSGLFEVVTDLQSYKASTGTELHYLELMAMGSILTILESSPNAQIQKADVRADVLVDCIRNSSNVQVQQTALLLVSVLAGITPELILHNVMPIFTFMGSGIMQRTDDYSTHVVQKTMDSVIPRVMESLRKRNKDALAGVSELLLSFVAAFEHVPSQRRLALFRSLMDLVGPGEYLFALAILLQNKLSDSKRAVQFSVDLLDCYQAKVLFETVERYVATILDSTQKKPTFSSHLVNSSPQLPKDGGTSMMAHLVALLGDRRLLSKCTGAFTSDGSRLAGLRTTLARIMNQVLSLSRQSQNVPRMQALCQRLLDILLGGLPMTDFIDTLRGLLNSSDDQAYYEALKSFEVRLTMKGSDSAAGQDASLSFLSDLTSIIENCSDASTRRIALSCIDGIAERFGKKDITAVMNATNTVVGNHCLGADSEEMQTTSLLSLSTIVEVSRDEFLPLIPQTLPKALSLFNSAIEADQCSNRLHRAAYSFFSAVLLYIPWTVTGLDLESLLKVSHGSANTSTSEEWSTERGEALDLVAKQVESKDCCGSLERTWSNAMEEGPEALKEHIGLLETLVGRLSKSAVCRQSEAFANLLIKAFDLRRIQFSGRNEDSYTDSEVEDVEDVSKKVAISMIYKMNDTTFRPIFTRLVDWAASSTSESKIHRQITLYGFFTHFFEVLKSIVTSYSGLILEDATEILSKIDLSSAISNLLWTKVIQTLQKTFKHDQDGFWQSPTHFNPISSALLEQIQPAAEASLTSELIPAITELTVVADSATHHKTINASILKYTRSDVPAVRVAVVKCQQSLTNRLGEEWLSLLPEMLPFISELQEDDDEVVERETLTWIKRIEEVLGESLAPMLQ
ncbi:MAG: hypothetical protein Q9174_005445, partial [Haloplaca sp. 1 TL-2023]